MAADILHVGFGIPYLVSTTFFVLLLAISASFADWMGVAHSGGGLGLGTGSVSLCLMIIILVLVGFLAITHRDIKDANNTAS